MNTRKRKNTSSKYKGVDFDKTSGTYRSRIKLNGKEIYLGRFRNEKKAALAYNEKAVKLFKKFAKLNVI